jgi:hypothetical protein
VPSTVAEFDLYQLRTIRDAGNGKVEANALA